MPLSCPKARCELGLQGVGIDSAEQTCRGHVSRAHVDQGAHNLPTPVSARDSRSQRNAGVHTDRPFDIDSDQDSRTQTWYVCSLHNEFNAAPDHCQRQPNYQDQGRTDPDATDECFRGQFHGGSQRSFVQERRGHRPPDL